VIDLWIQEFQGMYQENGAFVLTMHPWISGRAGRLLGLERLIRAIKAEPGVWWATCQQVAEWQIETRQNLDVVVPIP
jgi:peptidoglycan/xylan/chitin deacetylase (PgdA/CDA1 family)